MYSETVLSEQRTLWQSAGDAAAIVPADGCVDLIVRSEQVLLCGPQTRIIHAPADDVDPTVGVRLEAGTARKVLPIALSELRNRVVELRTALGSEAVALYDLMMRASNASRPDLVLSELLVDQAEPWVTTAHRLARTVSPRCRPGPGLVGAHAAQTNAGDLRLRVHHSGTHRACIPSTLASPAGTFTGRCVSDYGLCGSVTYDS